MSYVKKILVPFDDNLKSVRALEYAAMLAHGLNANITALHLLELEDYQSKAHFHAELEELIERQVRPKLKQIQKTYPDIRKIDLQTIGRKKAIPEHITDFAQDNNFDFIVMSSHGQFARNDWELRLKNTIAYQVVLKATCPVFTFTEIPVQSKVKNILLPLDLSDGSLYKVPLAIYMAEQFGACLHLLSASEHQEDHDELQQQLIRICDELTAKKINVIKTPIYLTTLADAIETYISSEPIDLVTIMSRPGFRWSDIWVSPKAKRIISKLHAPVLSIRSNRPVEVCNR